MKCLFLYKYLFQLQREIEIFTLSQGSSVWFENTLLAKSHLNQVNKTVHVISSYGNSGSLLNTDRWDMFAS